jgi:hypothetical protein
MAEHAIGLVEGSHRAGAVSVVIRVVSAGEAPVGTADLLCRCRGGDAEDLVVRDDPDAKSTRPERPPLSAS